jgi:hypothetical protein
MYIGLQAYNDERIAYIVMVGRSPKAAQYLLDSPAEAYASVSGSAISGGTASEYGVEQISNMASGGYRERFSPLVDRVPTAFFG